MESYLTFNMYRIRFVREQSTQVNIVFGKGKQKNNCFWQLVREETINLRPEFIRYK